MQPNLTITLFYFLSCFGSSETKKKDLRGSLVSRLTHPLFFSLVPLNQEEQKGAAPLIPSNSTTTFYFIKK